jgi:SAM-dependent methyltransferase
MRLSPSQWADHVSFSKSPDSWIQPFLDEIPAAESILELGSAGGGITYPLVEAGRDVTALDFVPSLVERLKERLGDDGAYLHDVETPLPFADGSFDWVISSGLLEHYSDAMMVQILKECARVARKGVISEIPNASCSKYVAWKRDLELRGAWEYGDETPRGSLISQYRKASLTVSREYSVDKKSFDSPEGYLLVTVGTK